MVNLFIPSYLGPLGSPIRAHRKEVHNRQLLWLLSNQSFDKIYIASQGYEPGEYVQDPRIHYIDIPPRNPATARNVLLDKHDEVGGIGFFLDNDMIARATLDSIIQVATSNMEWEMLGLTYIGNKDQSQEVPEKLVFKRLTSFATCAFLIKPHLGVRFDEELFDMEDKDFAYCLMLQHNLRYYQINNCTAWFYYFDENSKSTIYSSSSQRTDRYKVALARIKEKYDRHIQELGGGDHIKAIANLKYIKSISFYAHQRNHTQQHQGHQLF